MSTQLEEEDMEPVNFRDQEWQDLAPVKQDDGPNPVVPIAYQRHFAETMDYFRAVVQKNELSKRALRLTAEVIRLNPANYTAWAYRRSCLQNTESDLHRELDYVSNIAMDSPKNYQLWFHRRRIVERVDDPSQELEHTQIILDQDSKNYHAWSHRFWVIQHYNMYDTELDYTNLLLNQDLRNNSAWNHRHFVVKNTTGWTDEVIEREVGFTMSFIKKAPNNESAWNYLRGCRDAMSEDAIDALTKFVDEILKGDKDCVHAYSFLVELLIKSPQKKDNLARASKICNKLGSELDVIRKRYWDYQAERIKIM